MDTKYYKIILLSYTLYNNFNFGLIMTFIYIMFNIIAYFDKIDKYYSEYDPIDRTCRKICNFINLHDEIITYIFAIFYICFIESYFCPLFEITISCLTLYNIIKYDDITNWKVYTLFVVGVINCIVNYITYEYFISKFISVVLLAYHMKLFLL
jgi:hypothetical protein